MHDQSRKQLKRRIVIIDDHPLLRHKLTALIDNEPDLKVCAEAATQRDGLEVIATFRPDLVITDLSLGGDNGLALVQDIRSRYGDLPVLVLSMHDTRIWAEHAFKAGASGYVTKQKMAETLLIAIRRVLGGESYYEPEDED